MTAAMESLQQEKASLLDAGSGQTADNAKLQLQAGAAAALQAQEEVGANAAAEAAAAAKAAEEAAAKAAAEAAAAAKAAEEAAVAAAAALKAAEEAAAKAIIERDALVLQVAELQRQLQEFEAVLEKYESDKEAAAKAAAEALKKLQTEMQDTVALLSIGGVWLSSYSVFSCLQPEFSKE